MSRASKIIEKYYGLQTKEDIINASYEDARKRRSSSPDKLTSSYSKLQLPYEAPQHPGIPSIEAIEEGMRINKLTKGPSVCAVCRIGAVVVKGSGNICVVQEAEDLLYLQATGYKIRTPTVYAVFRHDSTFDGKTWPVYYMVQEYLEGEELSTPLWLGLDATARKQICSSLVEQLRQLRSIPPPHPSYYGRVHNQGWLEDSPLFQTCRKELCGPYNSYEDFCNAAVDSAQLQDALYSSPSVEQEIISDSLLSEFESAIKTWSSRPTFTHMDPAFKNILVRQVSNSDGTQGWEATMIDWERSGWFPSWMQAVAFRSCVWLLTIIDGKRGIITTHDTEEEEFMEMLSECWDESCHEQLSLFKRLGLGIGYAF
ncbi:hypothetical protein NX059_012097 [Plenodomus lindquistii]|nr:hypothetical protein NX059_012097 [Plenodomus lindquistii]